MQALSNQAVCLPSTAHFWACCDGCLHAAVALAKAVAGSTNTQRSMQLVGTATSAVVAVVACICACGCCADFVLHARSVVSALYSKRGEPTCVYF